MKSIRFLSLLTLLSLGLCACQVSDGGRKKKRTRPPLPGETESDLSWSRPTKPTDIASPFGIPASR